MITHHNQSRKGIALVLVLMLIVLMTVMIIAFFASVKTETRATHLVVGVQNSRQLADLAVQTVISQIQQATQTSSTRKPGTVSWASQPGMVRCYDNTGAEIEWYKLYSAQTMTVQTPAASLALIQSDLPELPGSTSGNWATPGSPNYGVFTDLNSPVTAADGQTLEYPIMNPAAATSIGTTTGSNATVVLGFDIQSTPGYISGTSSATNNQAAMPVRWLYVLQSGTMVPGVASGTPGVVNVAGASGTNPIVGRVAFWTDDDTCKLNVNTAADGTYFDTPRFSSPSEKNNIASLSGTQQDAAIVIDRQFAVTPPATNEFQRYIGGSAQTRLSYVLGTTISSSGIVNKSYLLTLLSPFMQWGGSEGGTLENSASVPLVTPTRQTPYATLDEWMFSTQPLVSGSRVATPGAVTASPAPLLTNSRLQQLRFFLSANSDAPEVNLFGQPRISIWPVYTYNLATNVFPPLAGTAPNTTPDAHVTPLDQMIANAATLTGVSSGRAPGGVATTPYTYYFGRENADSPTVDWSGTNSNKLNLSSGATNTRNQNIFVFLRTLASETIPGYGMSFDAKYSSAEMDQILTEVFDCCRSFDPTDASVATTYTTATGQVTPICIPQTDFASQYSTKGFGRFDSINEITLDFTQSEPSDLKNPTDNIYTGVLYVNLYSPSMGYPSIDPHIRIVVQSPGTANAGKINLNIVTADGAHAVFGTPANGANGSRNAFGVIPQQSVAYANSPGWNNSTPGTLLWGGAMGGRQLLLNKSASFMASSTNSAIAQPNNYMFSGLNMEIPSTSKTFSMAATPLEVKVYHCSSTPGSSTSGDGFDGTSADLVQDVIVQFPAFNNLPVPTNQSVGANAGQDLNDRFGDQTGYGPLDGGGSYIYIQNGDVAQSLVAGYNGDARLIAAQQFFDDTNPSVVQFGASSIGTSAQNSAFVKHPLYGLINQPSTGLAMAHSNWDVYCNGGARYQITGYSNPSTTSAGVTGKLVPGATYSSSVIPATGFIDATLAGKQGSPDATGDWDNGLAHFSDGPYINKADETGSQYNQSYFGSNGDMYYAGGAGGSGKSWNSPNRTVASPVMFGSLPTGVPLGKKSGSAYVPYGTVQAPSGGAVPWQTLLFRPQPGHYGGSNGGTTVEDEELLDWFWMPVVEPYAISTTLATTGKVNLNYQIAPFTYITRATALMGVLGSEYVIAAPTSSGTTYKNDSAGNYPTYRTPVKVLESDGVTLADNDGTFRQFKDRFATGEIFRSAAEICDIYLEPVTDPSGNTTSWGAGGTNDSTYIADATTFWSNNQLAGDNTRERPYNGLYSRLTTKSNTYTVHVRAQALKAPMNAPANTWVENTQQIVSEYRGSFTVNRYLDPQDTNIPDFMSTGINYPVSSSIGAFKYSLDNYYKYRVLEARQFLP